MKVLKFGGTSVGTPRSILSLKNIVESQSEPAVVVVSALGGITDKLIATTRMAMSGDEAYRAEFDAMVERHHNMIDTIITDTGRRAELTDELDRLFDQLASIYYGLYLIRDLGDKSQAAIVSYGERLSSRIVNALIEGSGWLDSRSFIKTERKRGDNRLDAPLTERLVREAFAEAPRITIVPGFISSDSTTGEVTNLGRGGSDYTAAIIAAALDADVLEIWTDVDGFMTADPRVVPTAYTIPSLTYNEATELCNFGAKVIYPPTIYPVYAKHIPIKVKNTFNPDGPDTVILDTVADDGKPIKGISSIAGVSLITLSGASMVGAVGINRRIFSALAQRGISVFTVSQTASESSTTIGVRQADSTAAVEALSEEFDKEISCGAIMPVSLLDDLASVAVIGENIRHSLGLPGELFTALGRSGIRVHSIAQGASQSNISVIVDAGSLRKSLNVIHDALFLSQYNQINLFIIGTGNVGSQLIDQINAQRDDLMATQRLKINIVGIANTRHVLFCREGIDPATYRSLLDKAPASSNAAILEGVIGMNIFNSIFVDCTASGEIADMYETLLSHNISVVAANKHACAGDYDRYARLKMAALRSGVKFLYETNVGAGLPIICTINDLCNSGDRILQIEAVLSGTLNYIFNEMSASTTFSQAVRKAAELGFTEPDPRVDLTGTDVVRKLVILAREAGYPLEQDDVECLPFIPDRILEGTIDEFWHKLPELDAEFERRRLELESRGRRMRYVARLNRGVASVGVEDVESAHPFYNLAGSNNIIMLNTERYRLFPMIIQGYGAGAEVTAAGVFANIMWIANVI